ncbi:hypothetical protein GCM10011506_44370 [Marivirga lumbricoides]|uniref:Pyrrolo-quinoline quinone repeat domain-containing protein n=1 Tax=Marivirga lumbricoides TaxID=1046115 RepID=A0ABQ1NBQ8_9BACT|nr:hypothetical protein GCM10011506_44370 [Marivirga lumbricoides]
MKIFLILLSALVCETIPVYPQSIEPVSNFLKLKWECEINFRNTLPARKENILFIADGFAIDAKNGEKVTSSGINLFNDTLLIHSTEEKLKITDIKNNKIISERTRNRSYYIGPNQVELGNDSIWIEIIDFKLIQCINLQNEEILWTKKSDSRIFNKPVIIGDEVFLSDATNLVILDKGSGNIISNISFSGPVLSGIIRYQGFLYMIVKDQGLIAFNYNTKKIEWEVSINRYSSRVNRIVIDEERVYFSDNNLHAVNRLDGSLVWEIGEKEGVYIKDTGLSKVKNYILFYDFEDNENVLTVADKDTGEILYQGSNSTVVGGNRDNPDGVAKEDLLLIDFMDELIDDNILIGVMDNKIYGLEILK